MDGLTIMSESLISLQELLKKEIIYYDDVPEKFRSDVHNFVEGETLTMIEGKIIIGHILFRRWLQKLGTRGFDYETDVKK